MRTCTRCHQDKAPDAFSKQVNSPDGLRYWCRACCTEQQREYRAKNRERVAAYQRKWYRANPEKAARRAKKQWIKANYGLTWDEYHAFIDNPCAICGTTEGRICLDHDHSTGALREALCDRCNRGLGFFSERAELLAAASAYIKRHAQREPTCAST